MKTNFMIRTSKLDEPEFFWNAVKQDRMNMMTLENEVFIYGEAELRTVFQMIISCLAYGFCECSFRKVDDYE